MFFTGLWHTIVRYCEMRSTVDYSSASASTDVEHSEVMLMPTVADYDVVSGSKVSLTLDGERVREFVIGLEP